MSYLIDTCALSEFTKPRPAASVDRWFASVPDDATFVSVLTLGELEKGIHRLASSRRRSTLERWFSDLRGRFEGRVLGVDDTIALEWGRISARCEASGKPIPVVDALLAATAIVHGLDIVTRNTSDIARAGAPIIDPWQP
jgi:predicted nucleic acid-binding protein